MGRRLAGELRQLREATGMTADAAAQKVRWSSSKLSRIERGLTCVRPPEVRPLARLYNVPESGISRLTAMAERAWQVRNDPDSDRNDVAEVLAWAPLALPLLLRTEAYHTAVLGTMQAVTMHSPGTTRELVKRNLLWQARLNSEDPIRVRAVLRESVLTQPYGTPAVMAHQLRHLSELAGRDNLDLRMLPDRAGAPGWLPPFTCTQFRADEAGVAVDDEVLIPLLDDFWKPEAEREIWLYQVAWRRLAEESEDLAGPLARALKHWA
jgi:transcriptional regulator with XRE-family HTH domain